MNNFGFKELYDVSLKTTYPIEIEGKKIEIGETVAAFDKIQLGTFDEKRNTSSATGGYDNRSLVLWDETQETRIRLTQGVFSKKQLAVMSNAKLVSNLNLEPIRINIRETLESDESNIITTKKPISEPLFIYDTKTGEKLAGFNFSGNTISISQPYQEVVVDYWYEYTDSSSSLIVGRPLTNGYLSLTGKTRVKDEVTGQVKTGIINIPKLKLMSDLSMRLGDNATPIMGVMDAVAIPVGNRGNKKVMEILFLEEDIDSDM